MNQESLSHDLALKYTFETFDFEKSSPIELLKSYQSNYDEIYSELKYPQGSKKINANPRTITTP